jgi:nitronate monooxygenase
MGTRFMATKEAPIHEAIKEELVKGTERDTALIMRTFRNTSRIYKVITSLPITEISEFNCSKGH